MIFFLAGSFFPPRDYTKSDIVHVYDKDLCRILPLQYRHDEVKDGVTVGYYTPSDDAFETAEKNKDNQCYCPGVGNYCPPKGLQNINPCHFGKCFPYYFDLRFKIKLFINFFISFRCSGVPVLSSFSTSRPFPQWRCWRNVSGFRKA